MADEDAAAQLVGAAIAVGAGMGATTAILLEMDLAAGVSGGVMWGILLAAALVTVLDRAGDRWLSTARRTVVGLALGSLVAVPVTLLLGVDGSPLVPTVVVVLVAGGALGGFLGFVHPGAGTADAGAPPA